MLPRCYRSALGYVRLLHYSPPPFLIPQVDLDVDFAADDEARAHLPDLAQYGVVATTYCVP